MAWLPPRDCLLRTPRRRRASGGSATTPHCEGIAFNGDGDLFVTADDALWRVTTQGEVEWVAADLADFLTGRLGSPVSVELVGFVPRPNLRQMELLGVEGLDAGQAVELLDDALTELRRPELSELVEAATKNYALLTEANDFEAFASEPPRSRPSCRPASLGRGR